MRTSCLRWRKEGGYAQICSTSQANAYWGLPVFNECGTTRQTSDVFDRYKKPFQSWNMFTGCIMRERSTPCNATLCPLQFFNCMCVILCATGQSKTCSLISAKRRGMHPPNKSWLSFFFFSPDCFLILLVAAQHMFADCYNQIESKMLVAVRNASIYILAAWIFNICMYRNTNMHMYANHMKHCCHLCMSSASLCAWMESRWGADWHLKRFPRKTWYA